MFGLGGIKLAIYGAVAGIIFVIGLSAYMYFSYTQKMMLQLRQEKLQFELALQTQTEALNQLEIQVERNENNRKELEENLSQAEEYQDTLLEKLYDHDLTRLSSQKPGLIETRINNATKELFDNFEHITTE